MDGHRIFTFCDCMFHCNFHSTLPFRGRAVVTYNSHSLFEKVRFSCWTHSWCFHSLLLSPSWLFSFPPLNNMLKFSGWSWWRDGLFGFFIFCLWWNWSSSFVCFSWEESNNVQAAFLFSQVILFPPFLSFRLSFHLSFPFLSKTKWTESQQTMKQKHKWKTKNQNNGNGTLFFFFFFTNKLKNINSFELLFLSLCFALAFPPSLPHTLQAFSPLTFDGDRQMAQTIRPCIQILQLMSHENILFIPFHILLRSSS